MEEKDKEVAALKIQTKWRESRKGKPKPESPTHSPPRSPSSPLNEPTRDRSSSFVPRQMLRIFDKALIAGDIDLYRSIQSEMRDRSSKHFGDENETPLHFRDFLEDELVFKMFEECSSIIMSPLCRAVRSVTCITRVKKILTKRNQNTGTDWTTLLTGSSSNMVSRCTSFAMGS